MSDAAVAWPESCYPPTVRAHHPFLEYAPGPGALRAVLPRHLRPGLDVLDIGCGVGLGACHLAASGARKVSYVGVDPDVAACRQARDVLAALPATLVDGRIVDGSLQAYLDTRPPAVDLILWTFAFHDCLDVAEPATHAPLCAAVAALLRPGGRLILLDGGFAPGAQADEIERTYAYMARIVGHDDRGRYFAPAAIAGLFTGAGLTTLERREVPLVALARVLGLPNARAILLVFGR